MSKRTREKKSAKPQQPAKPDEILVGRRFAQPYAKVRLLFDHPHSYRECNIVGQYDVPGFFYLESRFRLNPGEQPAIYTAFERDREKPGAGNGRRSDLDLLWSTRTLRSKFTSSTSCSSRSTRLFGGVCTRAQRQQHRHVHNLLQIAFDWSDF